MDLRPTREEKRKPKQLVLNRRLKLFIEVCKGETEEFINDYLDGVPEMLPEEREVILKYSLKHVK
jgi:hypothetical protein